MDVDHHDPKGQMAEDLFGFFAEPLDFVWYAFPWGEKGTPLEMFPEGPDVWHMELFKSISDHVIENLNRKDRGEDLLPFQCAVASGHGIGKSAAVSWLILWLMSTRPNARGVVTANTSNQLEGKTWAELAKWHNMLVNKEWFKWTASKFYCLMQKDGEKNWMFECVPWSEERTEAFAGLHNASSSAVMIFDEASAIPDKIWEVSEGAMTDGEPFWFTFGNPTRNTGRFRECFGKFRHRWLTKQVDSRSVRITNKGLLEGWVEDYGDDSDFVRVRIKGQFPRAGAAQFVPVDLVEEAQDRASELDEGAALTLGVDVARFGDDQSVLYFRRGRDGKSIPTIKYRGVDTMQLSSYVAEAADKYQPDLIFVDGVGVGGAVVDRLKQLGYKVVDVNAGSKAQDTQKYSNKRAEMWDRMREWLLGGCIPMDQELYDDLIGPEYRYDKSNRILLERKDEMKKRGLASPDCGDALSLTFAQPVARHDVRHSRHGMKRRVARDVDYVIFS